MIKLTKRLMAVAELVGEAETLIDVGCDHGFLPLYLLERGKIQFAYASDLRDGPLETAKKNIQKSGFSEKIQTVKSDGLLNLWDKKTDVITICGMGGRMIGKILSQSEEFVKSANRIVLQPMTEIDLLRDYLLKNGFKIEKEVIAREGHRFYNVMCVRAGKEKNSDLFSVSFGGCVEKSQENLDYFQNHLRILSLVYEAKKGIEDVSELEFLMKKLEKTIKSIKFKENR